MGVNYTPFPLVSFSVEHREGKSGQNDTRFGTQINYQLGTPLEQQTNPKAVSAMHTLAGSHYDLVERNNNIILEYPKKEMINLHTLHLITGHAGEKKSLGVSVKSKYGLDHIDCSASVLETAGGKIVYDNAAGYSVVLRDYHSDASGINTYTISGVAVDTKGNLSEKADTQVTVIQATINASMSSLTPAKISLTADGKTQQQLVLKVNDREGKPVDIEEKEISMQIKK